MNVNDLIGANPQLLQNLMDLGYSYTQIDNLGLYVGDQLSATSEADLRELLSTLNGESFLMKLDIRALADKLGSDIPTTQSALLLLASAITLFDEPIAEIKPSEIE